MKEDLDWTYYYVSYGYELYCNRKPTSIIVPFNYGTQEELEDMCKTLDELSAMYKELDFGKE